MNYQEYTKSDLGFKHIVANSREEATSNRGVKTSKALGTGVIIPFMLQGAAGGSPLQAREMAAAMFGTHSSTYAILKSAVSAANTIDPSWAGNLVEWRNEVSEFISFLRPQTILGKFGARGVPALRQVDFNISIPKQTTGSRASFVGEGRAIGVNQFSFDRLTLPHLKAGTISVITQELARFSKPNAATIVRDEIGAALTECLDLAFIDPANAGEAGVSPASITFGISPTPSTGGSDADSIREDIKRLIGRHLAGNNPPKAGVFIISSFAALAMSLMKNALGQDEFEGITIDGGKLAGLPVIVSDYVAKDFVALVNASEILLADDGEITFDASNQASIQMDTEPDNNSIIPGPTSLVSMYQTSSVALKSLRFINWARRRDTAVSYMVGANWAGSALVS